MGVSSKTLERLVFLGEQGLLMPRASIVELGAQEVFCANSVDAVGRLIDFFAALDPSVTHAADVGPDALRALADRGLMGSLMRACGFEYRALDIFEAPDTTLFDLNIDAPGPDLAGRFGLVTNFGTTEHVLNQFQAMKTAHELARPGGLIYHDLPMAGFFWHGYFCYTPLLFNDIARANDYEIVLQRFTKGARAPTSYLLSANGFPDDSYHDYGIEMILKKSRDEPFRMPLEVRTSLDVHTEFVERTRVYGSGHDNVRYQPLSGFTTQEVQSELVRRYRRKVRQLLVRR